MRKILLTESDKLQYQPAEFQVIYVESIATDTITTSNSSNEGVGDDGTGSRSDDDEFPDFDN